MVDVVALKVSAMVRTYNNPHTLAACIASIAVHPEIDDIAVTTNEPCGGPAYAIVEAARRQYPQVSLHVYPHMLLPPAQAAALPDNDPRCWWNYANFSMDCCRNDRVLKVDGDQVLIHDTARHLLERAYREVYLGIACIELTSPATMTAEFTGEEPRYWNRAIGVRFQRYRRYGFEHLWNQAWGKTRDWGPCFTGLGPALPGFLHYGWLTSVDPERPKAGLAQIPYTGTHHPLVDLEHAFALRQDLTHVGHYDTLTRQREQSLPALPEA